tara:strand:+ start:206 stop:1555 length:1350 start_codon:yes stop_codon:yes gene_type:complete
MAAGKGTRMKSKLPKMLQPICGKPMVGYVADAIRNTGINDIYGVIPGNADGFSQAFGYPITLINQQYGTHGTGSAIYSSKDIIKQSIDNVLVINGDLPLITPDTILMLMEHHNSSGADISLLTVKSIPTLDMGIVVKDANNRITHIAEYDSDRQISDGEGNVGAYCFKTYSLGKAIAKLKPNKDGDYRITDLIPMANNNSLRIGSVLVEDCDQALGVNNGIDLSLVRNIMQKRINEKWLLNGVSIIEPVYIDESVQLSSDSIIYPNTFIMGNSEVGPNTTIGPNSVITDSFIGEYSKITQSVVENAVLEDSIDVGPYSHIRPDSYIESNVHIGNFAEIKNSRIGRGTQIGHFSYIGDSVVGIEVNIGAGVITCNFDGLEKHRTSIGDRAFIGSDSLLVAPVNIGADASTGAGSVITKDVPDGATVIGMPARKTPQKKAFQDGKSNSLTT